MVVASRLFSARFASQKGKMKTCKILRHHQFRNFHSYTTKRSFCAQKPIVGGMKWQEISSAVTGINRGLKLRLATLRIAGKLSFVFFSHKSCLFFCFCCLKLFFHQKVHVVEAILLVLWLF